MLTQVPSNRNRGQMVSNLWSGKIPYICANGNNPAFLEDFGKTPEYGIL